MTEQRGISALKRQRGKRLNKKHKILINIWQDTYLNRVFFRKLSSLFVEFILGYSHPRLKSLVLMRRKEEDGVCVPSFQLYHAVALTTCIVELFHIFKNGSLESNILLLVPTSVLWVAPFCRTEIGSFLLSI